MKYHATYEQNHYKAVLIEKTIKTKRQNSILVVSDELYLLNLSYFKQQPLLTSSDNKKGKIAL